MNFIDRIKKVQKLLSTWGAGGCLIENSVDLYYLTGFELTAGTLVIFPRSFKLFVDGRYIELVKKRKEIISAPALEMEGFLKGKEKVAFDSTSVTYARFLKLKKMNATFKPIPGLLKGVRAVKEAKELALMKKSGRLALEGIEYAATQLKPGVTEKEIAHKFEAFCRERGAERLAFDPIVAFGANTAFPHYRAGDGVLKKDDIVLIDAGIVLDHYRSDLTRMFFLGKTNPELKKMYETVRRAQKASLDLCRPGTILEKLDNAARDVIEEEGFTDLLAHGLGHGIGLDVHEFPRVSRQGEDKKVSLEKGMVITVEPGLYLPGKGGVRYEDTIMITENGYEFAL